MYCYIYEVSNTPIDEEHRYSSFRLPDWFLGSMTDGTYNTQGDEREMALASFVETFGENCTYENGELRFTGNIKEPYCRNSFAEFRAAAAVLAVADYSVFSGQRHSTDFASAMNTLKHAYEDQYDHYIYDKDADELIPLDAWVRDLNLAEPVYFGGVIEFHL